MNSNKYIFEYLFELYKNLREYRNEIVHKNNFNLLNDNLEITTEARNGVKTSIVLDNDQLDSFTNSSLTISGLLLGNLSLNLKNDIFLKYSLDQIQNLHKLQLFNQKEPVLLETIVSVNEKDGKFTVNLKSINDQFKSNFPDFEILFKLIIIGYVDDKPSMSWIFNEYQVPEKDVLEINSKSYKFNALSLDYLKSIIKSEELEHINSILKQN